MFCEACKKNAATVHVTEITRFECGPEAAPFEYAQRHLCEPCAGLMDLPSQPLVVKTTMNIWKLLQEAQRARRDEVACKTCGLTLRGFRQGGKLGCSACYDTFEKHLEPLLLRMHNAERHVGRGPGKQAVAPRSETDKIRRARLRELQIRLERAVRGEDYEVAARLRDEIKLLLGSGASEGA